MARIVLVGPSGAGKTMYLASILRAAYTARADRRLPRVRPTLPQDAFTRLDRTAADLVLGGLPAATLDLTAYDLVVDLPGSSLLGIGARSVCVRIVDAPGSDVFPDRQASMSLETAGELSECTALMVVLPPPGARHAGDLSERLDDFVRRRRFRAASRAPVRRVAIVMTMADRLVPGMSGDAARRALDSANMHALIHDTVGDVGVAALRALSPVTRPASFLVSAVGCGPCLVDGPGATFSARRARRRNPGVETIDRWHPYRVLEPLEYLLRGFAWRSR